jgi:hypothetical protein
MERKLLKGGNLPGVLQRRQKRHVGIQSPVEALKAVGIHCVVHKRLLYGLHSAFKAGAIRQLREHL